RSSDLGGSIDPSQNVLNGCYFQHRAHCTAGDDTGTFGGRLHVYPGRTVARMDRVLQSVTVQLNVDHVLAGCVHGFLNRHWNFTRLTTTETDPTVTRSEERREGHA